MNYLTKIYLLHSKLHKFKSRLCKSKKTIRSFFKKHNNSYISWSGGKDSTAMMHLIIQNFPNIKIMTEKDDMDYPGELEYVKKLKNKYNLNLDIIKPDVNIWKKIQKYNMVEDLHSRNCDFSIKYFYDLIEKYKNENNFEGVFLGLRSEESKARLKNRKKRGLIYYNKTNEEYVCQPIADWTARDIYAYLFSNDIPIFDIYFKTKFTNMEKIRKSWILPSIYASRGQALWLKYYYPELFARLAKTNKEILRYA